MQPSPTSVDLVRFNIQLLEDARTLVRAHEQQGVAYQGPVAAHLRHVIEHHAALLMPAESGVVDYDSRCRERELERNSTLVQTRLAALQRVLRAWQSRLPNRALRVRGLCGHAGEHVFEVSSSTSRELAFVASHAVHHFALMKSHCQASGIDLEACLGADVGKAPATVAHERRLAAAPALHSTRQPTHQEPSCLPSFA